MAAADAARAAADADVVDLHPLVRRVVAARVRDPHEVDDLVQETLARVMTARSRLDDQALPPYAVAIARNLVITRAASEDRHRRYAPRLVDLDEPPRPDEALLQREESVAVAAALAQLAPRERATLLAHEVGGQATSSLAAESGSTPGAIAAQLHRTRAKLRVEYLLAVQRVEPPTARCRPVLLAISAGDRRRQRDLDTAAHLLECGSCAALSEPLLDRMNADAGGTRIAIGMDTDVVAARQKGREIAHEAGFAGTDLTLVATAISEIARNIVRFAGRGQMLIRLVEDASRAGITIIAKDSGPGIVDVDLALRDGYTTYGGLGLGLPGARRLMDEFEITSEVGKGTTVTMTKWRRGALPDSRRRSGEKTT